MSTQLTVDNDLLIFGKAALTESIERNNLRPYPRLKIANGDLMPIVTIESAAWANEIEVWEYDSWGIATVLAGAANDGGKVGIVARKMSYSQKTISDYTEIPWTELEQAKRTGGSLSDRYSQALVMGMKKKINDIGYNGDVDHNLQGLFTSQVMRMTLASTLASAANPDVMLALLNNAVSTVVNNSNGMWLPKKMVLPTAQHQLIATTPRASGSDLTVRQAFLNAQQELGQIEEIIEDNNLKGKGENGTDAMLILPYGLEGLNAESLEETQISEAEAAAFPLYYSLNLDITVPDEFRQWSDTVYRERAIARTGGVIVTDPFATLIVSGV